MNWDADRGRVVKVITIMSDEDLAAVVVERQFWAGENLEGVAVHVENCIGRCKHELGRQIIRRVDIVVTHYHLVVNKNSRIAETSCSRLVLLVRKVSDDKRLDLGRRKHDTCF